MTVAQVGALINIMFNPNLKIKNKAFSLVENLVSLLLITIIMVAGITLYLNASEVLAKALHKKMAVELLNSKIEDLKTAAVGWTKTVTSTIVEYKDKEITIEADGSYTVADINP